ncbi:hypothetical protein D9758_015579 [Tetrapyrgos nigripes]|uniref:Uncharacterized protein n=1 Tax=Tetrapyrgos nigripes TaxID=182062 RepID=A0A8H5CBV8_9AGAR|nr:hypothetical protein D9758_015579 [Tetrapyrgos nigripes]
MGQRHQVFLIARLVPHGSTTGQAYYRCIVAHHHQWCYGTLPLKGTRRFLALLKNENNAEIIRDEIRRAQGVYGRNVKGTADERGPLMPLMPCPYALFLLTQAWDCDVGDVKDSYASGAGLDSGALSPNMPSFGGDNNDGITIIDVTDPADPAYCFVSSPGSGPIDMKGYAGCYYDLKEEDDSLEPVEDYVLEAVRALEGVRVITSGMLAEAWPREYKANAGVTKATSSNSTGNAASELQAEVDLVPSLVELSISPAVERSLSTEDTSELEEMVWQPGKSELIKKVLMATNPFPDNGISLLVKILEHEFNSSNGNRFILNLSSFPSLSSEQILRVINTLSSTYPSIKSLNLSGNQNIYASTVAEVLKAIPGLLRLILLNTGIPDDDLLDLMSASPALFYHLHDLVHPAFLRSTSIQSQLSRDHQSSSLEALHPAYRHGLTAIFDAKTVASVPFFNPEQLIRAVTRQLTVLTSTENEDPFFSSSYGQGGLGPALALSAGTTIMPAQRDERGKEVFEPVVVVDGGDDWYSRTVASIPRSHSLDCFMGVGWMFFLNLPQFGMGSMDYAFIKPDQERLDNYIKEKSNSDSGSGPSPASDSMFLPAQVFKLHSIREFAKEMEKEGRPAPSEESIADFEAALGADDLTLESDESLVAKMQAGSQGAASAAMEMMRKFKVVKMMDEAQFMVLKRNCEIQFPMMLHMNLGSLVFTM